MVEVRIVLIYLSYLDEDILFKSDQAGNKCLKANKGQGGLYFRIKNAEEKLVMVVGGVKDLTLILLQLQLELSLVCAMSKAECHLFYKGFF
jgi:hypothetical protein